MIVRVTTRSDASVELLGLTLRGQVDPAELSVYLNRPMRFGPALIPPSDADFRIAALGQSEFGLRAERVPATMAGLLPAEPPMVSCADIVLTRPGRDAASARLASAQRVTECPAGTSLWPGRPGCWARSRLRVLPFALRPGGASRKVVVGANAALAVVDVDAAREQWRVAWQPLGGEWIALGWVARTDLIGIDVAVTLGVAHRTLAPVQRFASQGFVCGHTCDHAIALYVLRRAERVLVGELSEGGIVPQVSHVTRDGYA
ncbi:MAG TPA: hypothetical protein PKD61_16325, partial [Polyangiaceae bacterium]|nr:hypothetical protein [Polyangiaceae bacterium]